MKAGSKLEPHPLPEADHDCQAQGNDQKSADEYERQAQAEPAARNIAKPPHQIPDQAALKRAHSDS